MGEVSKELMGLLTQLLPGFLTAWVIYALTSHAKPPQFERVVQALIFSYLIQVLVMVEKSALLFIGQRWQLGSWSANSDLAASAVTAIAFGLVGAFFANNDGFYALARRMKLTKRPAYPSEWYGAFNTKVRYVLLHLSGGRRIIGWPRQWPSDCTAGHFELIDAAWVGDDNSLTSLSGNECILISAKEVEIVEFLKPLEGSNGSEASQSSAATAAVASLP